VTLGPNGPREMQPPSATVMSRPLLEFINQSISRSTNKPIYKGPTHPLKNLNRMNQSIMKHPDSMHIPVLHLPVCNDPVSASEVLATLFANAESTLPAWIQHTDTHSSLSPEKNHVAPRATDWPTKCTTGYQVVQRFGTNSASSFPVKTLHFSRVAGNVSDIHSSKAWVFQTSLLLTRVLNHLHL
jgi:hypothetical protein